MWHDRASVVLQTATADQRRAMTTVAEEDRRGAGRSWGVSKSPTIRGERYPLRIRDEQHGTILRAIARFILPLTNATGIEVFGPAIPSRKAHNFSLL